MNITTVKTAKQFASVCKRTGEYSEWVEQSFQSALEWAFVQYTNGNISYLPVARATGAKLPGRTSDTVTRYIEAACTNAKWDSKKRVYTYEVKGNRDFKKPAKAWYFSKPTLDNMEQNLADAIASGDEIAQATAEACVAVEEQRLADAQIMDVAAKIKQLHDAIAKKLSEGNVSNKLAAELAVGDLERLMGSLVLQTVAA